MPPVKPAFRKAVANALDSTAPPIDEESLRDGGEAMLYGLLQDARRLLKALLLLAANDLDGAGDSLARAIIDHGATAGWLAADLANNSQAFVTGYAVEWERVRKVWHQTHPRQKFPFADDPPIAPLPLPKESPVPKVRTRMKLAKMDEEYYSIYRLLSLNTHSSLASVGAGVRGPAEALRTSRLAGSGEMIFYIAGKLAETHPFAEWLDRMNEAKTQFVHDLERLGFGRKEPGAESRGEELPGDAVSPSP